MIFHTRHYEFLEIVMATSLSGFYISVYLISLCISCWVCVVCSEKETEEEVTSPKAACIDEFCPQSALVNCQNLPIDFLSCQPPEDMRGNDTKRAELGYGCTKYGGQKYHDVQKTSVICSVLEGVECYGNKTFRKEGFPCIKYTGHYFCSTLLYSILLGFLGMDRFCLGHTGTAVGKLLTLGGFGIWWIVDIVLLVTGSLTPEDGSNWEPYI